MKSWFLLGLSTLTLRNNVAEYFNTAFLYRLSEVVGNDAMLWQLICALGIQIATMQDKQTIRSQDLLAQDTQKQEAKRTELRSFLPRFV